MATWLGAERIPIVDPGAAAALRRGDSPPPRAVEPPEAALSRLRAGQASHPFWQNRLFRAVAAGALTKADYALVFGQYYLYSQSFTRYLAALMANCESDLHRAELAANIWEEGGGQALSERHAELFRRFLREGLGVDPEAVVFSDATRWFVHAYLDFCLRAPPAAASAFLSLGTEGIVPRMYAILLEGLRKAGVGEEHTGFFRLHMECDDAHAATLERIMASFAATPDWASTCERAMDHALTLRARFFDHLLASVEARRVERLLANIQRGESLAPDEPAEESILHRRDAPPLPLYGNAREDLGIEFTVERAPFRAEVFDVRLLRIAPGKRNERHKHPHESVFSVQSGHGRVTVNRATVEVGPGDLVFVPRWAVHQTACTSSEPLVILAITDFGLTEQAFLGDHLRVTRQKGTQAPRPR